MLFSWILEKYRKRKEKRTIVRELILSVRVDERQRNLFLESLDILDETGINVLYDRLIQFVESVEQNDMRLWFQSNQKNIASLKQKEQLDRQKDARSFNILLDNI